MQDIYFVENSEEMTDEERRWFQFEFLIYLTYAKTEQTAENKDLVFYKLEDQKIHQKSLITFKLN